MALHPSAAKKAAPAPKHAAAPPAAELAPIDFQSLQGQVYDRIRQVLIGGGFEPGERVSSRKLAARLGTSDMPVRAALGRLLAEGALVQNANGTIAVPRLNRRKFREVMELRALLEGKATEEACAHIDAAAIEELRAASVSLSEAIERNDIRSYLAFNHKLKFTIYNFCRSETLLAHIQTLWLQAGPFLHHLNKDLSQMTAANFHDEAIDALERGQKKKAGAAMSKDILSGMKFLLEHGEFAVEA